MAQIFHNDDHDTVVKKYAELVRKNNPEKFRVTMNMEEGKEVMIAGVAPDIIIKDASGVDILLAIEVETATSINSDQALERWKPIAEQVPVFQLLLPKGTVARAKRMCKKLGIKARFQEY